MKEILTLAEAANAAEQVLVPNRYPKPFKEAYGALTGIEIPEPGDRIVSVSTAGKRFLYMRGRDIPRSIEKVVDASPDTFTIGLSGTEWCSDFKAEVPNTRIKWQNLSEKRIGRLALIAPSGSDVTVITGQLRHSYPPLEVVTATPNLVNELGFTGVYNLRAAAGVNGGVEAWSMALNIPGVDLVDTGKTLAENGFMLLRDLVDVYPALVTVPQLEVQS